MRVRIDHNKNFWAIFGADCLIENWPELSTDQGVLVKKLDGWWYIWDPATDWMVDHTAFFTPEDIETGLAIVRARDAHGRFVKETV